MSEAKVKTAVVTELRALVDNPALLAHFLDVFQKRIREAQRAEGTRDLEGQLKDVERKIANGTTALLRMGWSESLQTALRHEEERAHKLRDAIASTKQTIVVPAPASIAAALKNLVVVLDKKPAEARALLSKLFARPLTFTPTDEGYTVTGGVDLQFHVDRVDSVGLGRKSSGGVLLPLTSTCSVSNSGRRR